MQAFLLPKPSEIARTFWDKRGELWAAGWFTFQEALGGFVLGSGLAILVALVLARWRLLGTALHAVRDRRERHPDHRVRPDHEHVVRAARTRARRW